MFKPEIREKYGGLEARIPAHGQQRQERTKPPRRTPHTAQQTNPKQENIRRRRGQRKPCSEVVLRISQK
jgi:hypothetical protein